MEVGNFQGSWQELCCPQNSLFTWSTVKMVLKSGDNTFLGILKVMKNTASNSIEFLCDHNKVGQQLHPTPIQIQCAPGFTLRSKDGEEYNRSNIVCKARRVVPEGLKCAKSKISSPFRPIPI